VHNCCCKCRLESVKKARGWANIVRESFCNVLGHVGRQIDGNEDVNLLSDQLTDGGRIGKERDNLRRGVSHCGFGQHLSGPASAYGVRRQDVVAEELELVAPRRVKRPRQHLVLTIECLGLCLRFRAGEAGVQRFLNAQADHIGDLSFKTKIAGGDASLKSVRPQSALAPRLRRRQLGNAPASLRRQLLRGLLHSITVPVIYSSRHVEA
jgi:hypothetical protein